MFCYSWKKNIYFCVRYNFCGWTTLKEIKVEIHNYVKSVKELLNILQISCSFRAPLTGIFQFYRKVARNCKYVNHFILARAQDMIRIRYYFQRLHHQVENKYAGVWHRRKVVEQWQGSDCPGRYWQTDSQTPRSVYPIIYRCQKALRLP